MAIENHYLAVDFGAESSRGILGTYSTGHLDLSEMHMFTTGPVNLQSRYTMGKVEINKTDTSLIWDFIRF